VDDRRTVRRVARPRRKPAPARRVAEATAERTLRGFQERIEAIYGARDKARGLAETFMWFVEEVGELSRALRGRDRQNLADEFADVLAWLVTLGSLAGVDIDAAASKYDRGCPRCGGQPCTCARRTRRVT
jgi:NTP pyrophosphatase (non-canonical NTP hydrolase)